MVSGGVYTPAINVDPSNNVGIGTASPLVRLHLSQSASGTYGPVIFLSNSANTANDVTGIYGSPASGTALPYRGGITFAPGNTGRVRIHTGNNANPGDGICCTFDGANVSLNSANTAAIFDASGSQQGLKLPATPGNSNANTLDAYVDGGAGSGGATFTATLKGLVSDPTTPVTVTGQYVLVGKMLVMQIYFANVNTTGASGAIYVTTGLAAALRPAQNAIGSVSMESMGTITGTGVHAICNTAAELYIAQNNSNAASTFVTHNAGAARGMTITVSYIVP
jgi:hypothetical protein